MAYKINLTKLALKDLKSCPKSDQQFIVGKLGTDLTTNPQPRGKTIKKIKGKKYDLYRLRINASQADRAFFRIEDDQVIIYRIVPKKDADKTLKHL